MILASFEPFRDIFNKVPMQHETKRQCKKKKKKKTSVCNNAFKSSIRVLIHGSLFAYPITFCEPPLHYDQRINVQLGSYTRIEPIEYSSEIFHRYIFVESTAEFLRMQRFWLHRYGRS